MTETGGFLQGLRTGLAKTRGALTDRLRGVFSGKNRDLIVDELTATLLGADLGVSLTERLIGSLKEEIAQKAINYDLCKEKLKREITAILSNRPAGDDKGDDPAGQIGPVGSTLAFLGVNGVGKTTTIGKIACQLTKRGKTVLLAAGDTFRAGAIEQLSLWGKRAGGGADIIRSTPGADPSSVIFDAVTAASARKSDYLLIDTAGRLQTNHNLMGELKKITRVISKALSDQPYERILVLDAITGQNGVSQARQFHEAVGITGVILTKLDTSAKGGMLISVVETLRVPVLYVGIGEGIDDLIPFCRDDYVEAMFEVVPTATPHGGERNHRTRCVR